jgi:hypothetical protein
MESNKILPLSQEIKTIFETNKINDLNRFMENRHKLNTCNIILRYLFYVVHYSGILTTTISVVYITNNDNDPSIENMKKVLWIGVGLNIFATMLTSFEQLNKSLSKKMLSDIREIRKGNYIDESELLDSMREPNIKP